MDDRTSGSRLGFGYYGVFLCYDQEEVVGFLALQNLVGELEVTNVAGSKKLIRGRGYASS